MVVVGNKIKLLLVYQVYLQILDQSFIRYVNVGMYN